MSRLPRMQVVRGLALRRLPGLDSTIRRFVRAPANSMAKACVTVKRLMDNNPRVINYADALKINTSWVIKVFVDVLFGRTDKSLDPR